MLEHSAANSKPALDEESFTRLLAAAYVMQEHQDRVRAKVSPLDLTEIISQVVETQHEIQTRSLAPDAALDLIAKRLCSVCGAAGVAISTVNGDNLRYRAGAGSAAGLVHSEMARQASLAAACWKTSTAFQSPLAQTDPRLNSAQCRRLGLQSLMGVPVFHDGQIAGAIEVYFSEISGFGEGEVRAAELMAGTASEVLADVAERELKDELESERASVLQALEMLEPELHKMAEQAAEQGESRPKAAAELCRACGHAFVGNETACGVCGASRETGMYPGAALQSKWAVLWERHLTGAEQDGMPLFRKPPPVEQVLPEKHPASFGVETRLGEKELEAEEVEDSVAAYENEAVVDYRGEPIEAIEVSPWNSAAEAHEWLTAHHPATPWNVLLERLKSRPGDTSLLLASLVLLLTLIWALWPRSDNSALANARPPAGASVKRRPRPKAPKLSLFEEAMVGLGLAVPPPAPEYMGDPNIKVWEDLQTALYYCPDADLYGATPKGRYTTQGEAQQDAFDPAFHKPCE